MVILLLTTAFGSTCESPLSESELRSMVDKAKIAIQAGDTEGHQKISSTLEQRLPCLLTQLPARPWADFLITLATVQYAQDNPAWSDSLAVALSVVPDHPDTPPHLLEDFIYPPPDLSNPQAIPAGTVIAIDGKLVLNHLPPLKGTHVAQIARVGKWETLLLRDESLPPTWIQTPATVETKPHPSERTRLARKKKPKPATEKSTGASRAKVQTPPTTERRSSWGSSSILGGIGDWQQSALSTSFAEVITRDAAGTSFGFATHGQQNLLPSIGVFWAASLSGQDSATPAGSPIPRRLVGFGDGFAGLSFLETPVSIWVGGGVTTTRVEEAGTERPLLVPHYLVGLAFHSTGSVPIDIAAGGGWAPWGSHAQLKGGATILQLGPIGIRVGAEGSFASANMGDITTPQPDREAIATSSRWTAGLSLGISWGNYKSPSPIVKYESHH